MEQLICNLKNGTTVRIYQHIFSPYCENGENMESIGERLKHWRKERGLTLTEISAKTGLSTGGLSAYERDEKQIGSKTLLALWREYNINISWILTGEIEHAELAPEEQYLIDIYRRADDRGKRTILRLVQGEDQEAGPPASGTGFAHIVS